jgi:His-Xaa-Ser system protein HxsD
VAEDQRRQSIELEIDLEVYDLNAVQRAVHRFTATHYVSFDVRAKKAIVALESKTGLRFPDLQRDVLNALLDEQVRGLISAETAPIREALIRAALGGSLPKKPPSRAP